MLLIVEERLGAPFVWDVLVTLLINNKDVYSLLGIFSTGGPLAKAEK